MSLEQFVKNRNAFPTEELDRYIGQHVAWNPDGTRILVSDRDPLKLGWSESERSAIIRIEP